MKTNGYGSGVVIRRWALVAVLTLASVSWRSSLRAEELSEYASLFQPPLREVWDQPRSDVDDARVQLGRVLYHEKRLSRDNDISCNSCHDVAGFGVDGVDFSVGFQGHKVGRNSPTTFNAAGHIAQFWDGRATTVEEQAKGPILAAGEMAMPDADAVVRRLKEIDGYDRLFAAAFPEDRDPINYDNVGTAIGAFERLLVTPSRWDEYLDGNQRALNEEELRGLHLFVENGCTTCHGGTLLGGRLYQKAGLVEPWPNAEDKGRYEITGSEADKFVFKVPSLRNIEKTGPYFHDASATSLKEAVKMMAWHQLGMKLDEDETSAIVAFLSTMTGDIPEELKVVPPMPDEVQTATGGFD